MERLTARHVSIVLLSVLVAAALAYLLRPIMDPDFLQLFDRLHGDRNWVSDFGDGNVAVFARRSMQGSYNSQNSGGACDERDG